MKKVSEILRITLVLAALMLMSGCSKWSYYAIETTYAEDATADLKPAPEIVKTEEYYKIIKNIKTVAVIAPERCKNEASSSATGAASGNGVVMSTDCGIEMGELERALAKEGYQVISWQVIANSEKMAKNAHENITRQQIAQKQGADVLLQINSLERTTVENSLHARWNRKFYESNKNGELLEPIQVNSNTRNELNKLTKEEEKKFSQEIPKSLSATIDASVINVATGRAIWFYQWTNSEKLEKENHMFSVQAACKKSCKTVNPKINIPTEKATSESSDSVSIEKSEENRQGLIYHKLLRDSIKNMITTFKS